MSLQDPAFRALFEDAPVGIVIVDRNMRIVDVNDAYCKMLGYTEAEMMGRLHPRGHPSRRSPAGRRVPAPLLPQRRGPTLQGGEALSREEGEVIWAEIAVTALLDRSGVSENVFSMARNITDRRALQGTLPVCTSCKKVRDPKGYWSEG